MLSKVDLTSRKSVIAAGVSVLENKLAAADTKPSLRINSDSIELGAGGTTDPDVKLYRSAADVLKTDDAFTAAGVVTGLAGAIFQGVETKFSRTASSDFTTALYVQGAGSTTWGVWANGKVVWGSSQDVQLYRESVNSVPRLRCDQPFKAVGGIINGRTAAHVLADLANNDLSISSDDSTITFTKRTSAGAIKTATLTLA